MQIGPDYTHLSFLQEFAIPDVRQNTVNTPAAVQNAVNAINESELLGFDRELRFSRDPQSRLGVVEVLNRSTGEVIVQIPSESIIDFAQNLQNVNAEG
ncbi:MAG TPA: flagellar protein FlaG [Bryobacteraceae bacterium]|nr:flagellar protein FlaG [Bryobacteraceae bacterium]